MPFTYSGDPSTTPRDEVRFLLGDTKETPQSLQDGEIDYLLRDGTSSNLAAILGAEALAQRHSAMSATSKSFGDVTLSYSHGETANRFLALATRLRRQSSRTFVPIMADTSAATFSIGMDDYAD